MGWSTSFDGIKGSGRGYESGQFGFNKYFIIKAVTEYDNNNNNDDPDKEEEEDYSDDYSDDSDKEEERKTIGMRKSYNLFN